MLNTIFNLVLMGLAITGVAVLISAALYFAIDLYREIKQ